MIYINDLNSIFLFQAIKNLMLRSGRRPFSVSASRSAGGGVHPTGISFSKCFCVFGIQYEFVFVFP